MYTRIIDFGTPEFGELLALRDLVLRKPLELQFNVEEIEKEYDQIHIGCYSKQNHLMGVLVLKPLSDKVVKMRQVAVQPTLRGQGIGKFLVDSSEEIAKMQSYEELVLSARLTAVPFYEKLEYKVISEIYQEVGIDHKKMKKDLK